LHANDEENAAMMCFEVQGQAVPKQSFRYARGQSFQTASVREWQNAVGWAAREQLGNVMLDGDLRVKIYFFLLRDTADLDNLAKGVLDGMQGIVYKNDKQIKELHLVKMLRSKAYVIVSVQEIRNYRQRYRIQPVDVYHQGKCKGE
jgi:crossover junction endodeoxyribonuclease RusA